MNKLARKKVKLWHLCLLLLTVANASYFSKNFFGWAITLCFFLFVPGYLLLSLLKHEIKSRWEIASFSLGLSLLLLMVGGLVLNSLHAFGLAQPLETLNIFITLDAITLILLTCNGNRSVDLLRLHLHISKQQIVFAMALTVLPMLAIGGAIRLNNGASDILTMILFAAIPILFILLIWRKNLKSIYPYAIFMIGLSVLLSTSLRSWSITGHDIQHEFQVFRIVSSNGFWNISNPKGDPYNACLSITILPTIIAKITTISAPYVFKVVFQMIFAFGLVPIYFFMERLVSKRGALTGAFIFMSFPPFFNDMPFLNRQEIAFVFFALLLLTTFLKMARRPKTILTIFCLLGLILSHYSSGYVTLCLLLLAWIFFKVLARERSKWQPFVLPALSVSIILIALLFTFLWNAQTTGTASGLRQTVVETIQGLWGHSSSQASGVTYGLFAPPTISPSAVLNNYAGAKANLVQYIEPLNLPVTGIGKAASHIVSAESLNNFLRAFSAKILQLLLLLGLVIFFFRQRRKTSIKEIYFYALALSCLVLLAMITLLPQLSVDYGVTRLFQQTLIITAPLIVLAAEFLLGFLGRFKMYAAIMFFALLFLDLSGFVPQLLGGYPPQSALNNAGVYYDLYYVHGGELTAARWVVQRDNDHPLAADSYATMRLNYSFGKERTINPLFANNTKYFYQDYANIHEGLYATFLSGDTIEYTYHSSLTNGNLVYVNQDSHIYEN